MTLARSVCEILDDHVTLEIECIDRLYLGLYVPVLQDPRGVAWFWKSHRGHDFASSSAMAPMTESFFLRRLRLHGMIQRVPRSRRYTVTPFGYRTAMFLTRA
jgi:hypothetical protein